MNKNIIFLAFLTIPISLLLLLSSKLFPSPKPIPVPIPTSTHQPAEKCDIGTITNLNTPKEGVSFVKDWEYCTNKLCFPAPEILDRCKGKQINLTGKVIVSQALCDPYPCKPVADLLGITLHGLNEADYRKYKDKIVRVEGILEWSGLQNGPTIEISRIDLY